jgi:hypothetical protein
MRRAWAGMAVAACAALLVLLTASPVAAGGFRPGHYTGTTDQGTEISFKVKKTVVKRFTYTVDINCEDGPHESKWVGAKAPIGEKGRFSAEFVSEDGNITSVVSGKLKRRKASGTIQTAGTLPNGWECQSDVGWSATRG